MLPQDFLRTPCQVRMAGLLQSKKPFFGHRALANPTACHPVTPLPVISDHVLSILKLASIFLGWGGERLLLQTFSYLKPSSMFNSITIKAQTLSIFIALSLKVKCRRRSKLNPRRQRRTRAQLFAHSVVSEGCHNRCLVFLLLSNMMNFCYGCVTLNSAQGSCRSSSAGSFIKFYELFKGKWSH